MGERRNRSLVVALVVGNIVLTLAVAGWAAWAVTDPEYWFPDACAEEGPRGDEGSRGERGPRGPQGPIGEAGPDADDALAAVDDVQGQVHDLDSRVANLEGVDPYDLDSRLSEVESRVSDVESRVDEACSTLAFDLDTFGC
jgi:hypothetical protein